MEVKTINEILSKRHKGTYINIEWTSNIESAAARKSGVSVVKVNNTTVRWGIKYRNIKSVKESQVSQQNSTPAKPWYKRIDDHPYLIQHLSDPSKIYLQLFTSQRESKMQTRYYINGIEATRQEIVDSGYVNKSSLETNSGCLIMNIPISNILSIGKKSS
jgi:hypothetical protein